MSVKSTSHTRRHLRMTNAKVKEVPEPLCDQGRDMSARTIKKAAEMISKRTSKFRMVGRKVPYLKLTCNLSPQYPDNALATPTGRPRISRQIVKLVFLQSINLFRVDFPRVSSRLPVDLRCNLAGYVQTSSDDHLQSNSATGELLSRNSSSRELLRPRGDDDRVEVAFHSSVGRVELHDVIARLEIGSREGSFLIGHSFEGGFAAEVGNDHVDRRSTSIRDAGGKQSQRQECAADQVLHIRIVTVG